MNINTEPLWSPKISEYSWLTENEPQFITIAKPGVYKSQPQAAIVTIFCGST